MQIKVTFYGPLKRYAQEDGLAVELPAGVKVSDLLDHFGVEDRIYIVILVNNGRVDEEEALKEGDEVKILSPIGGGGS
ncbi:MAG: MoaD/ThiS family protein [Firmicutes bacterium]|nr:MoaD/ThiS family protein [Bacillota bacterium]MCL5039068.1 MoaD/ThiS family protein [Bacillota bacterium]